MVATPERVAEVQRVCEKWELTATPIGRVTDDGIFRVKHHGLTVAAIPGQRLVEDCPIYHPEARESRGGRRPPRRRSRRCRRGPTSRRRWSCCSTAPNLASKRWVYEQYDSTVQASTVLGPGGDAGVLRVPGTDFGLAVTVDCNARLVALDPYEGGKAAVAEAARNVACTGARPLGITDCLNFGNPEKPEVFFQFREACRGIADACRAFGTPVTGGNVSFYNESPTGAVDPTPTIGMVGLLERVDRRVPSHFARRGDDVLILGATRGELGGSAYWAEIRGFVGGRTPPVDLEAERRAPGLPGGRGRARAAPLGPRRLRGRAAGGARRSGHRRPLRAVGPRRGAGSRGLRPRCRAGGPALRRGCGPGGALGRIPTGWRPWPTLARAHGVPLFRAGRVGGTTAGTARRVPGVDLGRGDRLRSTYFEAIPRRMQHADAERSAGE